MSHNRVVHEAYIRHVDSDMTSWVIHGFMGHACVTLESDMSHQVPLTHINTCQHGIKRLWWMYTLHCTCLPTPWYGNSISFTHTHTCALQQQGMWGLASCVIQRQQQVVGEFSFDRGMFVWQTLPEDAEPQYDTGISVSQRFHEESVTWTSFCQRWIHELLLHEDADSAWCRQDLALSLPHSTGYRDLYLQTPC